MPEQLTFAYEGQDLHGVSISGTIEASDGDDALAKLGAMGLRLLNLSVIDTPTRKPRPIRGDDLIVFNQHLAQLTKAGMPVEQGLRVIAQDMRRGRLKNSIASVAEALDRGTPLAEAFEAHRGQFPPLYGRLIDAGVRSNNLPGMLVNLGRHYELIHRMRAQFWQAIAYPAFVLLFMLVIATLFGMIVVPQLALLFTESDIPVPLLTKAFLWLGAWAPHVAMAACGLLVLVLIFWFIARQMQFDQWFIQTFLAPVPLFGTLLKYSAISRWCDAMSLGIEAGMPMPEAVDLASQAVGWKTLEWEGRVMVEKITQGQSVEYRGNERRPMLPLSVRTTISFAHERRNLAEALHSLSSVYQQLTELKLATLIALCVPISMLIVGALVFLTLLSMALPLIKFMTNLT